MEDKVELLPDERRARRILELIPDSSGLVQSLRLDATFATVAVDELEPLNTFCAEFKKASFDNPRSHTAFMNLYRAAEGLSIWVKEETQVSPDDAGTREIRPGDARKDGWRGYTEAQSRGERLSDEFVLPLGVQPDSPRTRTRLRHAAVQRLRLSAGSTRNRPEPQACAVCALSGGTSR